MTLGESREQATVRPRILVVHGALGSAAQMEPVRLALQAVGDAECVELPGHGNTPLAMDAEFGMPMFVQHLREAVQAVHRTTRSGNAAPFVFGYSMGGYVALALEAAYPGTLSGVVTLGTKSAWSPAVAAREAARLNPVIIAEKVPRFAELLRQRHEMAGGWELVLQRTGALLMQLGDHPVLTPQSMRAITTSVCVAAGELDETVSRDECAQYASYLQHGRAVVVAGAPHPIERVPMESLVQLVHAQLLSELPAANQKES